MIRHLFKLIWNRKRANALVIAEIFVSFLVLFAVSTLSLYSWTNYHRPLGFAYENVFSIDVQSSRRGSRPVGGAPAGARSRIPTRAGRARFAVSKRSRRRGRGWRSPPSFQRSEHLRGFRERRIDSSLASCTDEYKEVMGIEITRGRWFGPEDDGGGYEAVVITEALARRAFRRRGSDRPEHHAGIDERPADEPGVERRVVGVMRAFKQEGEMETEESYVLTRVVFSARSDAADRQHGPSHEAGRRRVRGSAARPRGRAGRGSRLVFQGGTHGDGSRTQPAAVHGAARRGCPGRPLPHPHGGPGPLRRALAERHHQDPRDRGPSGAGRVRKST